MKDTLFDTDSKLYNETLRNPFAAAVNISPNELKENLRGFLATAASIGIVPEDVANSSDILSSFIAKNKEESVRRVKLANKFLDVAEALIDREEKPLEGDDSAAVAMAKRLATVYCELYSAASKNVSSQLKELDVEGIRSQARYLFDNGPKVHTAVDVFIGCCCDAGIEIGPSEEDVRTLQALVSRYPYCGDDDIRKLAKKQFGSRAEITAAAVIEHDEPRTGFAM